MDALGFVPDWPAPAGVHAWQTVRAGGVSQPPYESLNLALHVGDDPDAVRKNRKRLFEALKLPSMPHFLDQQHTARVAKFSQPVKMGETPLLADAAWTDAPGVVLAVMTADCLPILLADEQGDCVAAIHAGWRGLENGVIDNTVATLPVMPQALTAWIGPGISHDHFEVGSEVYEAMLNGRRALPTHFDARGGKWLMDLAAIAAWQLKRLGVGRVVNSGLCTWSEPARFYSYRRDGRTGRMATLIWLD